MDLMWPEAIRAALNGEAPKYRVSDWEKAGADPVAVWLLD